jgi:hypothetical protein
VADRPVLVELGEVIGRRVRVEDGKWRWDGALHESVWIAVADVHTLERTMIVSDDLAADRIGRDVCIVMRSAGDDLATTQSPEVVAALLAGAR